MHALFAHGARGWDAGLAEYDADDPDDVKDLVRNEWWPFEDYDPTTLHPRYAGCLGACEGDVTSGFQLKILARSAKLERYLCAWHVTHHPQQHCGCRAIGAHGQFGRWSPLARAAQALQWALCRPALSRTLGTHPS